MESTIQTMTFKISFGDEIRRFTFIPRVTTFQQLEQFVTDGLPPSSLGYKLSWKDQEDDNIILKSQHDLDECANFMLSSDLTSLKIFVVEKASNPPAYNSNNANPMNDDGEEHDEVGLLVQEFRDFTGADFGGGNLEMHPRLRKKLGKINEKFGKKEKKCLEKLSKFRASPYFDEKSFLGQVQALNDVGLPASSPFIQVILAKKHVEINEQNAKKEKCRLRWGCRKNQLSDSEGCHLKKNQNRCCYSSCCREKWLSKQSPKVRDQLKVLEEQGLSHGFFIAKILEHLNVELNPKDEGDVLILKQIQSIQKEFSNIPEPVLIHVLRKVNSKKHSCIFKSCASKSN